jgi:hypothetical protein
VSVGEELCSWILVTGLLWAAVSAMILAISIHMEAERQAWGWGASFAVSSLCAAWCFGRLL